MVIPPAPPRWGRTPFSAIQPLHCIVNRKVVPDSPKRRRQLTALSPSFLVHRGVPEHIRSDNGSEFTAKCVRDWLGNIQPELWMLGRQLSEQVKTPQPPAGSLAGAPVQGRASFMVGMRQGKSGKTTSIRVPFPGELAIEAFL